jgi:hypothetical protein
MFSRLPGAVPEIPVSDVVAAVQYYRDQLGLTVDWFEAAIELAGVSRDQCRLFLAPETDKRSADCAWLRPAL